MSDVQITSHRTEVDRAVEKVLHKAARMIGGSAVGHAVDACPVDTGLLKNSITFAIGGEAPAILDYQSDEKDQNGERATGHYDGEAPEDDEGDITVYVGTNVEYAPYQELGTVNMDARPFLRPAMEDFKREYEQIVEQCCKEIR